MQAGSNTWVMRPAESQERMSCHCMLVHGAAGPEASPLAPQWKLKGCWTQVTAMDMGGLWPSEDADPVLWACRATIHLPLHGPQEQQQWPTLVHFPAAASSEAGHSSLIDGPPACQG